MNPFGVADPAPEIAVITPGPGVGDRTGPDQSAVNSVQPELNGSAVKKRRCSNGSSARTVFEVNLSVHDPVKVFDISDVPSVVLAEYTKKVIESCGRKIPVCGFCYPDVHARKLEIIEVEQISGRTPENKEQVMNS